MPALHEQRDDGALEVRIPVRFGRKSGVRSENKAMEKRVKAAAFYSFFCQSQPFIMGEELLTVCGSFRLQRKLFPKGSIAAFEVFAFEVLSLRTFIPRFL